MTDALPATTGNRPAYEYDPPGAAPTGLNAHDLRLYVRAVKDIQAAKTMGNQAGEVFAQMLTFARETWLRWEREEFGR